MRVIAGTAKGHQLTGPDRHTTRPATDLVRGAIFGMLEGMAEDWSLVLDLFSGTGALGIEALSRGAGWVDFVDREPRCCAIIKQNLEKTRLTDRAHVFCCSVNKAISLLNREYNIIIMDPPYPDKSITTTIAKIATSLLVGRDTMVVVTHSPHFNLDNEYPPLKLVKERRHGDSCIAFYQKEVLL